MRLAAFAPSIPTNVVSSLENCAIRTDEDLLFSGLDSFYRLPLGTTSLQEFKRYKELVTELSSAPAISAGDILHLEESGRTTAASLSIGVLAFDELMGGFIGTRVIEISGDRGAGKTVLAMNAVIGCLVNHSDSYAVWIDTTGGFSVDRAMGIIPSSHKEASKSILERLQVSLVFEIESFYDVLEELTSSVKSSSYRLCCIVIDTVTPLLGPLLSATSSQGHALMTDCMRQLREVSRCHSVPILVINNTAAARHSLATFHRKPALGPSFAFLTDASLWLSSSVGHERDDQAEHCSFHFAEVLKSRITRSGIRTAFKIERGVVSAI